MERLQKFMASCGVASRRECEKIIEQGRVKVNSVVAVLGDKIDPENDTITLDGKSLKSETKKYYIMLNKPLDVVTTAKDEKGRANVVDLVNKDLKVRLFPVGRLDINTEGLVLLTNDGEFANYVTHPSNKIKKTYLARVKGGFVKKEELFKFKKGIELEDGKTAPAEAEIIEYYPDNTTLLQITIHEGRNRQIRRMCNAINHPVIDLMRTSIGAVKLGNLPYGKWRHLTKEEVTALLKPTRGKK